MEREFWLERWRNQEIGFHQPDVNPWLRKSWPDMGIPRDSAVLVPLCGKSLDLRWLAEQGHSVFGVELAEAAVRAFFEEASLPFHVTRWGHLQRFQSGKLVVYCGDFMDLTVRHLPGVAAVYDRAALTALPPKMRATYADHLMRVIPDHCRMLLLTLEYDQERVPGPPHCVTGAEVETLFGSRCRIESACRTMARRLPPKFAEAGLQAVEEVVYRLVKLA